MRGLSSDPRLAERHPEFPAGSEFRREFFRIARVFAYSRINSHCVSNVLLQIPCSWAQRIFLEGAENLVGGAGNFSAAQRIALRSRRREHAMSSRPAGGAAAMGQGAGAGPAAFQIEAVYLRRSSGFATSRAQSMKSCATGLRVRFFKVM